MLERDDQTTLRLGYHGRAPEPGGISGSLVYEVPRPGDGELFVPGKAIAVQHSWSPGGERINCTSVALLKDSIRTACEG